MIAAVVNKAKDFCRSITAEFSWIGPEVSIGQACSITGFVIQSLKNMSGMIKAKGTIAVRDYGEHGWDFNQKWEAVRIIQDGARIWIVKYDDKETVLEEKDYAAVKNSYLRTGSPSYLAVISEEKWIVGMIEEFMEKGRDALTVQEYRGPMDAYKGPCVCRDLRAGEINHDRWLKLTNGGRFPAHCFKCSCGHTWHHDEKYDKWVRVSKEAFSWLTKYNGQVMRFMHFNDKGFACLTTEIGGHWVG